MPLPSDAFTISGGCNCRAIRYKVSVPAFESRPQNPYRNPGVDAKTIPPHPRIPIVAIDHCNDCRRATGALLPMAVVTVISWVNTTCKSQSNANREIEMPANELFDFGSVGSKDVYLSFFKSSPKRCRWFCGRCGTNLAYTIDEGVIPEEWAWPKMLDLWLGSVDREDLERMGPPERMLWCEKSIPWVMELARNGAEGVPEHPTTKMDELVEGTWKSETSSTDDWDYSASSKRAAQYSAVAQNQPPPGSRGIDELLDGARSYLERLSPQQALAEYREHTAGRPAKREREH